MAIAAQWQTVSSFSVATSLYTVPASTASTTFYPYARDLILTNSGTASALVALGTAASAATAASSFAIPTGGTVILTQCQVPQGSIVYGNVAVGGQLGQLSIGFGTNVSYI